MVDAINVGTQQPNADNAALAFFARAFDLGFSNSRCLVMLWGEQAQTHQRQAGT